MSRLPLTAGAIADAVVGMKNNGRVAKILK